MKKQKISSKRLNVYIKPEIEKKARAVSILEKKSVSAVVSIAVDKYTSRILSKHKQTGQDLLNVITKVDNDGK